MMQGFPWGELGLPVDSDAGAIRRAYAQKLKAMDVDADPQGFARLREARDVALQRAKRAVPAVDAPPAEPEVAAPPLPWPLAGALILREGFGDVTAPLPDPSGAMPFIAPAWRASAEQGLVPHVAWPFFAPVLDRAGPSLSLIQRPDERLYALLLEGGDDLAPMGAEEEAEAQACLAAILADATTGSLARHDAIEAWLADVMARSWPRCAPLLEDVAQVMGWSGRAGHLGESPQVAFLTQRLAGYQFQRDVASPDHPHHAAWEELSRDGEAGWLRRRLFRAKRISALLTHIRRHYPELEDHLNYSRIQSWTHKAEQSWSFNWYVPAAILAFRLLVSFFSPDEDKAKEQEQWRNKAFAQQVSQAIEGSFGAGHGTDWLKAHQGELADTLAANLSLKDQVPPETRSPAQVVSDIIRTRSYFAARLAGGQELDQAMEQRLAVLDALRGDDRGCELFLASGHTPAGLALKPEVGAAAQKLFTRQAEEGRLVRSMPKGGNSATVPGLLVRKVKVESGLDMDRVTAAMQNKGSAADRCLVTRALLRATLRWKGKEREAILSTL
ncbi:hypothetical protein EOE18_07780 [Novosphingobium umbonatum]|uniref:J domain-containing protein n=1 Tax=Novosphingobium umbonatum TaxID=1908524 RepID=A0A3S2YA24_9SPHN|nr:hypothetical protein [Novosphingobium umbonatum]RVU05866.1 hypothetical protein EOE18_07780 [Novosphingobium umbonatum]